MVTGAAGYVGGEVLAVAEGLGLSAVGTWHRRPPPTGGHQVDVRDRAAVECVVRDLRPDAVVHCAYVYGGPDRWSVTAEGSAVVAAVTAAAGVRLVHVSSDVVFDGTADRAYREEDPTGAVTPYAEAKVAAEGLVAAADPGAAIARAALVVGPSVRGHDPQRRLVLDALAGTRATTFFTDVVRTPVGVTDLARALVELATASDLPGPVHLGGSEAVTRADLADLLAAPQQVRRGPAPEGVGPLRVPLDSSLAASVLTTRLRGVSELAAQGAL